MGCSRSVDKNVKSQDPIPDQDGEFQERNPEVDSKNFVDKTDNSKSESDILKDVTKKPGTDVGKENTEGHVSMYDLLLDQNDVEQDDDVMLKYKESIRLMKEESRKPAAPKSESSKVGNSSGYGRSKSLLDGLEDDSCNNENHAPSNANDIQISKSSSSGAPSLQSLKMPSTSNQHSSSSSSTDNTHHHPLPDGISSPLRAVGNGTIGMSPGRSGASLSLGSSIDDAMSTTSSLPPRHRSTSQRPLPGQPSPLSSPAARGEGSAGAWKGDTFKGDEDNSRTSTTNTTSTKLTFTTPLVTISAITAVPFSTSAGSSAVYGVRKGSVEETVDILVGDDRPWGRGDMLTMGGGPEKGKDDLVLRRRIKELEENVRDLETQLLTDNTDRNSNSSNNNNDINNNPQLPEHTHKVLPRARAISLNTTPSPSSSSTTITTADASSSSESSSSSSRKVVVPMSGPQMEAEMFLRKLSWEKAVLAAHLNVDLMGEDMPYTPSYMNQSQSLSPRTSQSQLPRTVSEEVSSRSLLASNLYGPWAEEMLSAIDEACSLSDASNKRIETKKEFERAAVTTSMASGREGKGPQDGGNGDGDGGRDRPWNLEEIQQFTASVTELALQVKTLSEESTLLPVSVSYDRRATGDTAAAAGSAVTPVPEPLYTPEHMMMSWSESLSPINNMGDGDTDEVGDEDEMDVFFRNGSRAATSASGSGSLVGSGSGRDLRLWIWISCWIWICIWGHCQYYYRY
eukprot:gene4560-9056_t